jgi:hypothetical protein
MRILIANPQLRPPVPDRAQPGDAVRPRQRIADLTMNAK